MVQASQDGDITEEEAEQLIRYNALRFDSLLTDVFDEHLLNAQKRTNPHSLENAVHKLTDYAQLKNDAQIKNGTPAKDDAITDNVEATTNIHEQTGDANPDHGYETDGDVKMVDEQDTTQEIKAQTNFGEVNPDAEALNPRHRDAESTLSERMSYNHSKAKADSDRLNNLESNSTESKTDVFEDDKIDQDMSDNSK